MSKEPQKPKPRPGRKPFTPTISVRNYKPDENVILASLFKEVPQRDPHSGALVLAVGPRNSGGGGTPPPNP